MKCVFRAAAACVIHCCEQLDFDLVEEPLLIDADVLLLKGKIKGQNVIRIESFFSILSRKQTYPAIILSCNFPF